MAEFAFAAGSKKADGTTVSRKEKADPMAYIFIGREKGFRPERTPQEWRKLFIVLARMANEADSKVTQNRFGLAIVFDALVELEKVAKKALGKDYESEVERHWTDAQAEDAKRAADSNRRMSEKNRTDEQDVEKALAESVKEGGSKRK